MTTITRKTNCCCISQACWMLTASIAGLQRKLLSSLKFLLSKEVLASPKIQKLMDLVDHPSTLSQPLLDDEDLFFWAQIALDESVQEQSGLDLLPLLLKHNLCPKESRMHSLIAGWQARRGLLLCLMRCVLPDNAVSKTFFFSSCIAHQTSCHRHEK